MLFQQLTQAVRWIRQAPLFAGGIVAVLALAIGANTAMFTLVNAVLMRPLPLRTPGELVSFAIVRPGTDRQPLSLPDLGDFQSQSRTLEALVACFGWSVNLTGEGEAERLQAMRVSPDYFEVTGATIELGRAIQPSDEHEPVVLITHGLWQRKFGGRADAVGKTLVLNGEAFTIAGVVRPDFVSLV
ncbi:MAG TPA: ABC transporter permease, partial [Vicinamibacterales bacterium]